MGIKRYLAAGMAGLTMMMTATTTLPTMAETILNEEGYDLSGFAYQWPELFSKDDTIEVTDTSYKSHNVNVQMSVHHTVRYVGDLNDDTVIDIADAVLCARLVVQDKSLTLSPTGMLNADCNEDSQRDDTDLTRLLQYLAKMIPDDEFISEHHQTYHVADVHLRYIECFRGAFAKGSFPEKGSGQLERISKMANDNNAIFAINCDYCEIRNNGITYRNGIMYRDVKRSDVGVLYKDGVMDVLTDAQYRALSDEQRANIWQTTAFAPGLVWDGVPKRGFTGTLSIAHPRSGLGYYEPGHYCFVQVDGRAPGYSDGMTLDEYAALFASLGVKEAYNMDGGSSSEIIFMGQTFNHPSGVQIGSTGGRSSSDILYIGELLPEE